MLNACAAERNVNGGEEAGANFLAGGICLPDEQEPPGEGGISEPL